MRTIVAAISFVLGSYLAARTIAALYRVADLRYALRREWRRGVGPIILWGGTAIAAAMLMDKRAFQYGFIGYVAISVALMVASRLWYRLRLRE